MREPSARASRLTSLAIAVEVAVSPITTAAMTTPIAAIGDAEDAFDAADCTTNTGADGTTNRATNRPGRAIAFISALVRAALHATDDALRMRKVRHRDKR